MNMRNRYPRSSITANGNSPQRRTDGSLQVYTYNVNKG